MSASVYASLSVPADGQIFTVFCIEWDLFAYTLNKIEGTTLPQTSAEPIDLEELCCVFFQPEKTNDNHYTLLINDLHQTAQDLQDAYLNLENVIDPDLIDCYIYELNSVQMRYKFLLTSIRNYELRTQKNPEDFYTKNPLELSES